MRRMCQAVLFVVLALPSCYQAHERAPLLAAPADAGLSANDVAPVPGDAAPTPMDAPLDAALECPLVRARASCLETFAIPAGVPSELPFEHDGCGCCFSTHCDVLGVDPVARRIRLATRLCEDTCVCDECATPRGTCTLPPLPSDALGQWTVNVNDVDAFVIGVVDTLDPTLPGPAGCATYAEPDTCGGATPDFTTGPVRGDVCVEHARLTDREVLRLHDRCWGCGQLASECRVTVRPRLTDDLPPGADLDLLARDYLTDCDVDCPGVCLDRTIECAVPPLVPGDTYRVIVDGEVVRTFLGGETGPSPCTGP